MKPVHALVGLPALVGFAVVALPVNDLAINPGLGDGYITFDGPGCSTNANGGGINGGGAAAHNSLGDASGGNGHNKKRPINAGLRPRVAGDIIINGNHSSLNTNGRGINGGGDGAHTSLGNSSAGNGHNNRRDTGIGLRSRVAGDIIINGNNSSLDTSGGGGAASSGIGDSSGGHGNKRRFTCAGLRSCVAGDIIVNGDNTNGVTAPSFPPPTLSRVVSISSSLSPTCSRGRCRISKLIIRGLHEDQEVLKRFMERKKRLDTGMVHCLPTNPCSSKSLGARSRLDSKTGDPCPVLEYLFDHRGIPSIPAEDMIAHPFPSP
ncbi:hypothetical protein V8F20_004450 [Naviculisporaceae sp. PSN 640]